MSGGSVLITGGAGFIGCNLADRLLAMGKRVVILDAFVRDGAHKNARWLLERYPSERLRILEGDVRDQEGVRALVAEASAVVHLAAQVAVTVSLEDPMLDFEVNAFGTLVVLEALKAARDADGVARPMVFASTNKVYGSYENLELSDLRGGRYQPRDEALAATGFDETLPLCFVTPYGCSNGVADQYALDYARSYGLPVAVLRMSCVMGEHQWGTEDQGWVAHFCRAALRGDPVTIYGDGRQVRDVLWVGDAVETYVAALERLNAGDVAVLGQAFNLGGGVANSVTILDVISEIERFMRRPLPHEFAGWRPGDQRYFVTDRRKVTRTFGLAEPKPWRRGLARLLAWQRSQAGLKRVSEPEGCRV